jgi:hypothetical protein
MTSVNVVRNMGLELRSLPTDEVLEYLEGKPLPLPNNLDGGGKAGMNPALSAVRSYTCLRPLDDVRLPTPWQPWAAARIPWSS